MTWQPSPDEPLKIARTRLGPIPLNADHPDRRYLLDGQNRIASMAWAFFSGNSPLPNDLSEQEHETWGKGERLCVDLQRRCFEFVPASAGSEGFLFPVSAFFDTQLAHTALIEKLTKTWLGVPQADQDAAIQWYKHCEQAFKSAKLVETIFEGATREEAREAFLHICQAGVAMSADDFDAAIGYNCTD